MNKFIKTIKTNKHVHAYMRAYKHACVRTYIRTYVNTLNCIDGGIYLACVTRTWSYWGTMVIFDFGFKLGRVGAPR